MESVAVEIDINNFPIKEAILFFKRIDPKTSNKLIRLAKRKYESAYVVDEIQTIGRKVVQELIYDAYEPSQYKRTYKLLNSILAASDVDGKKNSGSLALYSDPEIAEATATEELFSYAAFFEMPSEFKTFLPPRGIQSRPENYRPFFEVWERLMERKNIEYSRDAILTSIQDLMPPEIQK